MGGLFAVTEHHFLYHIASLPQLASRSGKRSRCDAPPSYRENLSSSLAACFASFPQVLEVPLSALKYGTVRRLLQDPFDRSVWLYTDAFVCQLVVSKESAQVWRLYLDQGEHLVDLFVRLRWYTCA